MRVGQSKKPRYRQSIAWRVPWWAREGYRRARFEAYPEDFEPPEFFDITDFRDLPESEHGWRELDTWAVGGLGLFERQTKPLEPVIDDGHRTGLEFEDESRHMSGEAVPLLREFFDGVTVHTEFPYGWTQSAYSRSAAEGKGLTDVVVCAYDWERYRKRRRIVGSATLNDKWGYLKSYRWLENRGPVTAAGWLEKGPYTERYLKEIWSLLNDNGFLATNGSFGGYWTPMPLPDHFEAAHAVELKQSNWREALEQAERADYADYQWVALDAGHLRSARENAAAFEDAGVGLLAIARGGLVELVPAAERHPDPAALDRVDLRERSVAQLTPDAVEAAEPEAEPEEPEDADGNDGPEQAPLDAY